MELRAGKLTTLLGAPLCSESRLSRLIPRLRQATVFGLSAMVLMALAFPAQCGSVDLISNGSFSDIGTETTSFVIANAVWTPPSDTGTLPSWTGTGAIVCLVAGTPTTNFCGNGYTLWPGPGIGATGPTIGPPSGLGPNFVAIDADTQNSDGGYISQTISVTPGQSYQVSFYQAASQLDGSFWVNPTQDQWLVSFDVPGDLCSPESFTNSTTCQSQSSQEMMNPGEGFVPWMSQSMTFTAPQGNETTEVLSFFAYGGPAGQPPIALLDGVSVVASPEPATYTFMGIGLVGVLAVFRKRLKKRG